MEVLENARCKQTPTIHGQVNQNEAVNKCWAIAEGAVGPKLKTGRGPRFITIHSNGVDGCVPSGLLIFISHIGAKGDYHYSVNHEYFQECLKESVAPKYST